MCVCLFCFLFLQQHFRMPEHFGSIILVKRSFKVIYLEAFLEGGGMRWSILLLILIVT